HFCHFLAFPNSSGHFRHFLTSLGYFCKLPLNKEEQNTRSSKATSSGSSLRTSDPPGEWVRGGHPTGHEHHRATSSSGMDTTRQHIHRVITPPGPHLTGHGLPHQAVEGSNRARTPPVGTPTGGPHRAVGFPTSGGSHRARTPPVGTGWDFLPVEDFPPPVGTDEVPLWGVSVFLGILGF
ncbi:hypothetical protein Taro_029115, partial [Colocasia esculenta]|nr:hypothetical protein [Colocasia esculenta]